MTSKHRSLQQEVQDLRNHVFNGVDLIEHLLRDPTETAKAWAREWCATEIARGTDETTPRQPEKPVAWYRWGGSALRPIIAWGDWPPPEPDDTAWYPLYSSPEGRPAVEPAAYGHPKTQPCERVLTTAPRP